MLVEQLEHEGKEAEAELLQERLDNACKQRQELLQQLDREREHAAEVLRALLHFSGFSSCGTPTLEPYWRAKANSS